MPQLASSVKLIVAAQEVRKLDSFSGGWRYDQNSVDSDLTMTGWTVLALRACQDVGINVPRGALVRGLKFLLKCYNPASRGFANQPNGPAEIGATAIAALCLFLLDAGSRPEAQVAGNALTQKPANNDNTPDSYFVIYCQTLAALKTDDATWRDVSTMTFDKLYNSTTDR